MKKIAVLVGIFIIGVAVWLLWKDKELPDKELVRQQPIAVSKYGQSFTSSLNNLLASYFALSEGFVNWDSASIQTHAQVLKNSLDSSQFTELKKDTLIYQTADTYLQTMKSDLNSMAGKNDITSKRRSFQSLSQNLYDFLRTVRFNSSGIYLQECPMAFNDTEAAAWLSKSVEIRNPYLGMHHPKYKSGMLECGSVKDSLNFR